MIKSDRKALRRSVLILGILFMIGLIDLGFQVFTGQAAHQSILSLLVLSISLLSLLVLIVWFGFVLLRPRGVDQRRTQALQEDPSLLAASQPVPDENALSLPATIQLRLRRRYGLAMSGIISVVIVISSSNGLPFSWTLPGLAMTLAIPLVTFLIFTVIMYLTARSLIHYDLEVNEQGLSVISVTIKTTVKWSDARHFAVNEPKQPKHAKVYELATSETVARWMWLPPEMTFFSLLKPTLPREEYDQKMQAVVQLIAAKTHLPLYDSGPSKVK